MDRTRNSIEFEVACFHLAEKKIKPSKEEINQLVDELMQVLPEIVYETETYEEAHARNFAKVKHWFDNVIARGITRKLEKHLTIIKTQIPDHLKRKESHQQNKEQQEKYQRIRQRNQRIRQCEQIPQRQEIFIFYNIPAGSQEILQGTFPHGNVVQGTLTPLLQYNTSVGSQEILQEVVPHGNVAQGTPTSLSQYNTPAEGHCKKIQVQIQKKNEPTSLKTVTLKIQKNQLVDNNKFEPDREVVQEMVGFPKTNDNYPTQCADSDFIMELVAKSDQNSYSMPFDRNLYNIPLDLPENFLDSDI